MKRTKLPESAGFDLDVKQAPGQGLSGKFIVPPFSVLRAMEGDWQRRKRQWLALGIESEVGRTAKAYDLSEQWARGANDDKSEGTSVFDPVLCELMYAWFCPQGGQVIDPFAGGSVRGIVATYMGRCYWGSELRPEQVQANYEQAEKITPDQIKVPIKISSAMLRQEFQPCTEDFIKDVCKGRCCEGSDGISVVIHHTEEEHIKSLGAEIEDGFILPDERGLCPFKADSGFCEIHDKGKPFGCAASPFTISPGGTLIVRNRYRLLKCYKSEGAVPAYAVHRWSLDQIFGETESQGIVESVEAGEKEIQANISYNKLEILIDNHEKHNEKTIETELPELYWVCGDAWTELRNAPPEADFIFTCPPYGDLEVYSELEGDLSNMDYEEFLVPYTKIIRRACLKLKQDRFACIVVANFRDKRGFYHNLVGDTITAFEKGGMHFYNDAILVTAIGSLPIRVGKQFTSGRKLGKTHQNILVFYKGDPKNIKGNFSSDS